jgi:hypothetical protein
MPATSWNVVPVSGPCGPARDGDRHHAGRPLAHLPRHAPHVPRPDEEPERDGRDPDPEQIAHPAAGDRVVGDAGLLDGRDELVVAARDARRDVRQRLASALVAALGLGGAALDGLRDAAHPVRADDDALEGALAHHVLELRVRDTPDADVLEGAEEEHGQRDEDEPRRRRGERHARLRSLTRASLAPLSVWLLVVRHWVSRPPLAICACRGSRQSAA